MGVAAAATIRCRRTILPDGQQLHACHPVRNPIGKHAFSTEDLINELEAKGYELKLQFQAPDPPAAKALHPAPPHVSSSSSSIAGAGEVEVLY